MTVLNAIVQNIEKKSLKYEILKDRNLPDIILKYNLIFWVV